MQKINQILQSVPSGSLFFSSWLEKEGISYELQRTYRNSNWFTAIADGVMKRSNEVISVNGALASMNKQLEKSFYISAMSALELEGFSHFAQMGQPNLFIGSIKDKLPFWFKKYEWKANIIELKSTYFSNEIGLESLEQGNNKLLVASVERAFLECLHLTPKYFSLMDLFYVMEQLTTLRPSLLQKLLEEQKSVKVKRLFFYMAEKANHFWFNDIDFENIDLGKGKRMLSSNTDGVFNKKYQIVIPKELEEYE